MLKKKKNNGHKRIWQDVIIPKTKKIVNRSVYRTSRIYFNFISKQKYDLIIEEWVHNQFAYTLLLLLCFSSLLQHVYVQTGQRNTLESIMQIIEYYDNFNDFMYWLGLLFSLCVVTIILKLNDVHHVYITLSRLLLGLLVVSFLCHRTIKRCVGFYYYNNIFRK